MGKLRKDGDGVDLRDGDLISFAYGIPPRAVVARLVERDGHLFALTPHETPKECRLDKLQKYVGGFYKTMPKSNDPDEVEASIFRKRRALSEGEQR